MANHCGAKTRAGGRCRRHSMPNGRCDMHGGKSTGPKVYNAGKNNLKHGLYSRYLTDAELQMVGSVPLGSLDAEIRLMKFRVSRILAAEHAAHGEPELEEVIEHDLIGTEGSRKDSKSKVRDYPALLERTVARIQALELARKDLMKVAEGDDEAAKGPISRIVVEVVSAKPSHDHDGTAG
jgi:hypothetical protein